MKKKNKTISNIIRVVVLVICGAVLGLNIYSFNANSLVGNKLPMPFGYGAAVVLSGSMEPELSVGDLIIVSKEKEYQVNDVVVFQDTSMLVVHRIVAIEGNLVTTKGDANNVEDAPIEKSAIKGKVIGCVPGIGTLVNFIKTPAGTICIVLLALILIEVPRRRELKRDDEERQKIIEEIQRMKDQMK